MPVAGRKPKPDGQKRNRVAPVHEWTEIKNVPYTSAPKLPSRMPDGRGWPAWTKRWWASVSTMPHCSLWSDSDWQFVFDTALIAAEFHRGDTKVATELRQREKVLGTTADARRDLRIRYVEDAPVLEEAAGVTNIGDYRAAIS